MRSYTLYSSYKSWKGKSGMNITNQPKNVKSSYQNEDSGKFVTILGLEGRHIETVEWLPTSDHFI